MSDMDILSIRREFPITTDMTYLNSAWVAPSPRVVEEAAREFNARKNRQMPHRLDEWLQAREALREAFARLINADADEIAITTNTTEGTNLFGSSIDVRPGDNIVLDELDYPSNTFVWRHHQKTRGLENRVVLHREDGAAPMEAFERAVDEHTRMIFVSLVTSGNGYVHDAAALSKLARAHSAHLAVDATQAVGAIPVDVRAMGIDLLTCATYKWLLGPMGLAFVYVRKEVQDEIPPLLHGWAQATSLGRPQLERYADERNGVLDGWRLAQDISPEGVHANARKYEHGTILFQGFFEMLAALNYVQSLGWDAILSRLQTFGRHLQLGLADTGVRMFTPVGNQSPIVSFLPDRVEELGQYLEDRHIRVGTRPPRIRVSPHFFNTNEELDLLIAEVRRFTHP